MHVLPIIGIMVLGAILTVVGMLAALTAFACLVLILAWAADLIAGRRAANVAPAS